ncbi:MAG: HemK2/MTQ2 family protein methyltransferase [Rhodococcus sp. (in: high G+C Gram-positive bacteria)]|uniref:HemK2/MTQ2 family protein methyltransferase n=1 Tax=Rhodococcus sp. TaxID=1831 RepID=UPI003BB6938C
MYRPQEDSRLLAHAYGCAGPPSDAKVLDFCTGTGILAVTAARAGAKSVTALDIAPLAVLTARLNAWSRRLPIRALRGDLGVARRLGPFDVIVSNPPYVPAPCGARDPRWDAGPDGRAVVDPLCRAMPNLLRPGGFALIVHSEFTGVDITLDMLREGGVKATVVARERIPFGPVMRGRTDYLVECRTYSPSDTFDSYAEDGIEEVVVVRADRPEIPR